VLFGAALRLGVRFASMGSMLTSKCGVAWVTAPWGKHVYERMLALFRNCPPRWGATLVGHRGGVCGQGRAEFRIETAF
jgi:hypothetical protein